MAIIEDGKEVNNDAANPAAQENNQDEFESGGNPDLNGGTGAEAFGGDDQAAPGQAHEETPGSEPDARLDPQRIEENIFKKLDERLEKLRPPEPPPQPITEEQWQRHEQEWGVPRSTIQKTLDVVIKAERRIQSMIDQRFSALEKDASLNRLAKEQGFADIGRLRQGIDEFLNDYDPKDHSNPLLLKKAAIYARGLMAGKDIRTVRNSDERNRQIANRLRPGRSEGSTSAPNRGLTTSQREAAELLEGGEAEYQKLAKNRSRVIAI